MKNVLDDVNNRMGQYLEEKTRNSKNKDMERQSKMKDKIKFDYNSDEKSIIIKSITMLRNELLSQERDVAVDEKLKRCRQRQRCSQTCRTNRVKFKKHY